MREPARDKGRLEDILQAIEYAKQFTENATFEDFAKDKRTYFAVVKNVEIIGEAAYMISLEFKEKHPELPWKVIINMRHVLVHGYTSIVPEMLWQTVKEDLDPLKLQVQKYLNDFSE